MKYLVLFISNHEIMEFFLNEQIPEVIIYLQLSMFVIWFVWLTGIWISQGKLKSKIYNLETDSIHTTNSETTFPNISTGKESKTFQVIINHLQAIKDEGRRGTAPNTALLVKNTQDILNTGSSFLRSVLSLFLVLGLLGTLFGLASSLSKFSILASGDMTIDFLKQNLQLLLKNLGGAFIPSICGVFITIVGVFLYSVFQRVTNIPLGNLIERKTLTEWVPNILENPQDKEKNHLEQLNILIQEHVRLAKENEEAVNGFKAVAETFKTEAGDLATNVESASRTLKILKQSSENLKNFSDKFVESVGHITSFQQELKDIYQQNAADSKTFRKSVEIILIDNKIFQDIVADQFKAQSEEAQGLFERLKLYEEGYLESRKDIDQNLNKLLVTSTETNEKIGSQNAETVGAVVKGLATEVGLPLQERLAEELSSVSSNLGKGLGQINENLNESLSLITENIGEKLSHIGDKYSETTNRFEEFVQKLGEVKTGIDSINLPLNEAATDIKGIATDFDNRTSTLLKNIHRDFETQNSTMQEQLSNLVGLKESVGHLSGKFDNLGQRINSFNEEAGKLEQKFSQYKEFRSRTSAASTEPKPITLDPTRWEQFKNRFRRNKKN